MLTKNEIQVRAPAVFATTPAPHCSGRYAMIPTVDAIAALAEAGYVPVEARQQALGQKKWDRELHAKHMVRMRLKDTGHLTKKQMALGTVPEVIIINSSDGSCPLDLELGWFRQVCSNGLIAFAAIDAYKTIHKNVTIEAMVERARAMTSGGGGVFAQIQAWNAMELTVKQAQAFAKKAVALRVGEARAANYDPDSFLVPLRKEDEAPTLWNIFNRVQEHGMRGDFTGMSTAEDGTRRALTGRPLTDIGAEIRFNKDLWQLAAKVAEKT